MLKQNDLSQRFSEHLAQLQQHVRQILESHFLQSIWIYAGVSYRYFQDDLTAPFKINPHFNYFFPYAKAENSWLYLDGVNKPKIYFYAPQDYWHCAPTPPTEAFFSEAFDWVIFHDAQDIAKWIENPTVCLFIGEDEELAKSLGFGAINSQKALNILHFARSIKTEFEIEQLYQAQFPALKGHHAAKQAFLEGRSEREIHLAYLQASGQLESELPYGNIVALNAHAAILHYTELELFAPSSRHSFLIDAGATHLNYASDITRTYAADPQSEFAALIKAVDGFKHEIIQQMRVGVNYLQYHTQMHQWMAKLLHDFDFVRLSPEQIFEEGISRAFFPHGLGHLLGLQVHDVGGFMQNARGTQKRPPEAYPSLRCLRDLQPGMVLTIEPGFYFIEMLLAPWKSSHLGHTFNWQKIADFSVYGGIRSEDNIVIRPEGAENLTEKALITLNA